MSAFDIFDFISNINSITKNKNAGFILIRNLLLLSLFLGLLLFLLIELQYLKKLESPIKFLLLFSFLGILLTVTCISILFKLNLIEYLVIKTTFLLLIIFVAFSIVIGSSLNRSKIDSSNSLYNTKWFDYKKENK